MVSHCVDVLHNLAHRMNEDLGAHQWSKHSSLDLKKDIEILMKSLMDLEVYVEKEGRTLDPDKMPMPNAISVGLADLMHGSALADYNTQFERNCEHHQLTPVSTLLDHLKTQNTPLQNSHSSPTTELSTLNTPSTIAPTPLLLLLSPMASHRYLHKSHT